VDYEGVCGLGGWVWGWGGGGGGGGCFVQSFCFIGGMSGKRKVIGVNKGETDQKDVRLAGSKKNLFGKMRKSRVAVSTTEKKRGFKGRGIVEGKISANRGHTLIEKKKKKTNKVICEVEERCSKANSPKKQQVGGKGKGENACC